MDAYFAVVTLLLVALTLSWAARRPRPLPRGLVAFAVQGAERPESSRPAAERLSRASSGSAPSPAQGGSVPERRRPLTPDQMAVSRRQFFNRAWTASFMTFLGLFGMSTLSFLWPKLTGGFGTEITAGNYDDLIKEVGPENGFKPKFIAEGRFWLTYYEGTGDSPVYLAIGAKELKMQALYRKCVHLGCSVPHCEKSMLFECPCHGSKYRLNGEYYGGPAPRGLDRFPLSVAGGNVVVDTGDLQTGPPRGTNTWDRFAEPVGNFCVPT